MVNIPDKKARRKRSRALIVFLIFIALIAGGSLYFFGTLSFLKPKDLGVKYTREDYNNVIKKLGMNISKDLEEDKKSKGGLNYKDYNWSFSDYQHKTFTLTSSEVSAFFNYIAPDFWWFKDTQASIDSNGDIITSSKADISKMKRDLFSDVASKIPVPLPSSANLYTKGDFSIVNNKIIMTPKVFEVGSIGIPKQYTTGSNLAVFSNYLERFITVIPELKINNAGVKDGQFFFDGVVPTKVSVTHK